MNRRHFFKQKFRLKMEEIWPEMELHFFKESDFAKAPSTLRRDYFYYLEIYFLQHFLFYKYSLKELSHQQHLINV